VVITSPRRGEISQTNFVRKVAKLVHPNDGALSFYTELEQRRILDNYYRALEHTFPVEYNSDDSIFFKTLGFGALMSALPYVFNLTLTQVAGFRVEDIVKMLGSISDFDFESWRQKGTGNQAELDAADDLRQELSRRLQTSPAEKRDSIPL